MYESQKAIAEDINSSFRLQGEDVLSETWLMEQMRDAKFPTTTLGYLDYLYHKTRNISNFIHMNFGTVFNHTVLKLIKQRDSEEWRNEMLDYAETLKSSDFPLCKLAVNVLSLVY